VLPCSSGALGSAWVKGSLAIQCVREVSSSHVEFLPCALEDSVEREHGVSPPPRQPALPVTFTEERVSSLGICFLNL